MQDPRSFSSLNGIRPPAPRQQYIEPLDEFQDGGAFKFQWYRPDRDAKRPSTRMGMPDRYFGQPYMPKTGRYEGQGYEEYEGEGFLDVFKRAGRRLKNAYTSEIGTAVRNLVPGTHPYSTKAYPGEQHQPMFHQGTVEYVPSKPANKISTANWSGPGTQVIKRLRRGDKPIGFVDKTANLHDVQYSITNARYGRGEISEKEAVKGIREADKRMLRNLERARREGLDSMKNITPAAAGIAGKVAGEEVGKLPPGAFGGIETAKAGDY